MVNSRGIFMGYILPHSKLQRNPRESRPFDILPPFITERQKTAAWSKKHGGLREHHLTLDFCVVKAWCTTPFCLASCKNHPGKSPSAELSAKWFDGDIGQVWATSWTCLKAQLQPFSPLASWTAHVELLAGSSRALNQTSSGHYNTPASNNFKWTNVLNCLVCLVWNMRFQLYDNQLWLIMI